MEAKGPHNFGGFFKRSDFQIFFLMPVNRNCRKEDQVFIRLQSCYSILISGPDEYLVFLMFKVSYEVPYMFI